MNDTQRDDDNSLQLADGLKAAVLISVLGAIAMFADHAMVAATETSAPTTNSVSVAPAETDTESADEPADVQRTAMARQLVTGRAVGAPASRLYPEPAADASRDEEGHPASF